MKKIILLLTVFLTVQYAVAQQVTVTGVVTEENGESVIGASVKEKGTNNGTITDPDGNFSISVPVGATLDFSYLGLTTQSRKITGAGKLSIVLKPDAQVLDEVVVTAMAQKIEKKRLNIAVQSVSGDALTDSRSPNFVTALQGKVAGINVTVGGGSPNSGAKVQIRAPGSMSTFQSNSPLYILDGVAIQGGVSDINPADIESVTVLKGAAASALYGQQASNGVIMVTTKRGQAGKLQVNATASWQVDNVVQLPSQQSTYGTGSLGFYKPDSQGGSGGWGPPLAPGTPTYDNMKNYFQQGLYQKYDVNMAGGSDKSTIYAALGYSKHEGTVVNDYLDKVTALIKGEFKLASNLTANLMLNTAHNEYRGPGGAGPTQNSYGYVQSAYTWPITDDILNYAERDGSPHFRHFAERDKYKSPISPLFGRYNDYDKAVAARNLITAALVYEPIKKLKITGRLNYETTNSVRERYTVPRFNSVLLPDMLGVYEPDPDPAKDKVKHTAYTNAAKRLAEYGFPIPPQGKATDSPEFIDYLEKYGAARQIYTDKYNSVSSLNESDFERMRKESDVDYRSRVGYYNKTLSTSQYINVVGMINYSMDLPKEIHLEAMLGGEATDRKSSGLNAYGYHFQVPGTFSLLNTDQATRIDEATYSNRRMGGVFGELRADYKGLINLSTTCRADWTSTMYWKYMPYYYPSVTGGVVFSELFDLSNDVFSFGKLRANWARTGKSPEAAYLYGRRYALWVTLPDQGYGYNPSNTIAVENLQPELYDSWEIGTDLRFFNSRTRLDAAYYETDSRNQILSSVRSSPASGIILQTLNGGWINNQGVEITLEQDIIKNKEFSWTSALNFGLNRGKVKALPEDMDQLPGTQYGSVYTIPVLNGTTTGLSGKDYLRTPEGKVIVDENGYPKINPARDVEIGNREPDFLLGFTSNFSYRNITLSFLLDGRMGGSVYNYTAQSMMSSGAHRMNEVYRGRQVVWDGVVEQEDGSFKPNTTPIMLDFTTLNNYYFIVDSNFIEDGSYIRLSYVTIGYDLSKHLPKQIFKSLKASLTGRNLFLLSKYTGSDPQINANTSENGTGSMGIDYYPVPSTRSFNFTLSATF